MKVTGIIEKNADGHYSIACNEMIGNYGLGGYGDTLSDAKQDFLEVISDAKASYLKTNGVLPKEMETIEVEYRYSLTDFFAFFDWINVSRFAKVAGINESKMRQYKVGTAFASEKTREKIMAAIQRMSTELASVSL